MEIKNELIDSEVRGAENKKTVSKSFNEAERGKRACIKCGCDKSHIKCPIAEKKIL